MQDMNPTSLFVDLTGRLGLNYEFLLTGYEAQIWRDGFLTTLYLVAITSRSACASVSSLRPA